MSRLPGGLGAGRAQRLRGGGEHIETAARASTAPAEAPTALLAPTAPAAEDSAHAALSVVSASAGEGCAGEGDDDVCSSSSSSLRLTAEDRKTEEGRGDLAPPVGSGDGNHSDGVAHGAELAAAVDLDSLLVLAASEGDMEQVQELLRKGASVNALYIPPLQAGVKPSGCTPLHAGAHSQMFSLWLLQIGNVLGH